MSSHARRMFTYLNAKKRGLLNKSTRGEEEEEDPFGPKMILNRRESVVQSLHADTAAAEVTAPSRPWYTTILPAK